MSEDKEHGRTMNETTSRRTAADLSQSASSGRLPVVVVACQVLQDMLDALLPPDLAADLSYMDYGLHRLPGRMTETLQDILDGIEEPSLIVLGYGLCGNGLNGLRAGKHTLLVPRVDDCIALLLGSRHAYLTEFAAVPGTYYLSAGWLESGSHPLSEYEEYAEKYGREDAEWIMDQQYQNYERLALVAHSQSDLEHYRPTAQRVARFCRRWDMRYEEILGSDEYVRCLVETALTLSTDGRGGPGQSGADFVIVPPGGEVRQDMFISLR
jgi:hypothetical protein